MLNFANFHCMIVNENVGGGGCMNFETEEIEFKSCITGDLYKEVIAFANTNGGNLCWHR